MWVVLCDADDISAIWAAVQLRKAVAEPVEVVLPRDLAFGATLTQTIDVDGRSTSHISLQDRRELDAVSTILVRSISPSAGWLERLPDHDRAYAIEEMTAFFTSWLHGVSCRVLNPPTSTWSSTRSIAGTRLLAAASGLETLPWSFSSSLTSVPFSADLSTAPTDDPELVGAMTMTPGLLEASGFVIEESGNFATSDIPVPTETVDTLGSFDGFETEVGTTHFEGGRDEQVLVVGTTVIPRTGLSFDLDTESLQELGRLSCLDVFEASFVDGMFNHLDTDPSFHEYGNAAVEALVNL